jgi:hypothetical protein
LRGFATLSIDGDGLGGFHLSILPYELIFVAKRADCGEGGRRLVAKRLERVDEHSV